MSEDNFDWTSGQETGTPDAPRIAPAEFVIEDVDTGVDADAVAAQSEERRSFQVPPGCYQFRVLGFFSEPTQKTQTVYLQGQPYQMTAWGLTVKFGVADDPQSQIGDYFLLPPSDPRDLQLYRDGASAIDGEPGFMCKKFGHFLNRLYPGEYPVGSTKMPAAARQIINWVGRTVYAEVVPERAKAKPQLNPRTGQPYPPKNQIRLYSYDTKPIPPRKPPTPARVGTPMGSRQSAAGPLPGQQNLPLPRPQTGPGQAAGVKSSGLANI